MFTDRIGLHSVLVPIIGLVITNHVQELGYSFDYLENTGV